MRIIFVTYDFPFPPTSGGKIRAYEIIKALSVEHEITLYSYVRDDSFKNYLSEMRKYCAKVATFKRAAIWSPRHFLRSFFSPFPGTITPYENNLLRESLLTELRMGNFGAVHFESFYSSRYLPDVRNLGIVTVMGNENVEYEVYSKFVKMLPFYLFPLKIALMFDIYKMRNYETSVWKTSDINLAVSEEDAQKINKFSGKQCYVIPNGASVFPISSTRKANDPPSILFVGNLKYLQNDQGIKHYLKNIFPKILKEIPSVSFKLVTTFVPNWLTKYKNNVKVIIDSKSPFNKFAGEADLFVNPVEIKGGTRIKLVEAASCGLPVVTRDSSLLGFSKFQVGRDIVTAESDEEFAEAVVNLLRNHEMRDKMGKSARKVFLDNYTWEKSTSQVLALYRNITRL